MTEIDGPSDPKVISRIADRCMMEDCGLRPVAVGIGRSAVKLELVLVWTCADHRDAIAAVLRARDVDPDRYLHQLSATCTVPECHGTPCGAAADYVLVDSDAETAYTVCARHRDSRSILQR